MSEVCYADKHGVKEVFPASDSTRHRLMNRPVDPFPAGQLMGGKRYWRIDLVLAWLARQDADHEPEAGDADEHSADAANGATHQPKANVAPRQPEANVANPL